MRCSNCGSEFNTNADTCPVCGFKNTMNSADNQPNLNKNGFGQPDPNFGQPNQGFGQQGIGQGSEQRFGQPGPGFGSTQGGAPNWYNSNSNFGQPNSYGPGYQLPVGNAPEFTLLLIIGLVYTFCCCNLIIGILGLCFTFSMNSAYKMGNAEAYYRDKKIANIVYIVGVIIWGLMLVLGIMSGLLEAILG